MLEFLIQFIFIILIMSGLVTLMFLLLYPVARAWMWFLDVTFEHWWKRKQEQEKKRGQ